jgi:hypothetical protein
MTQEIERLKATPWEDMTKAERVKLLLADSDAYIAAVPAGHWLDVADGVAKVGRTQE